MTMSFATDLSLAVCSTYTEGVNNGSANPTPYVVIYGGEVPANVRAPLGAANVLATLNQSVDAFNDPTADEDLGYTQAEATAIADQAATGDGDAKFYRQFDRDGNPVWQGTVSLPNGGGDMELSSVGIISGVNVVVQSYVFRVPM